MGGKTNNVGGKKRQPRKNENFRFSAFRRFPGQAGAAIDIYGKFQYRSSRSRAVTRSPRCFSAENKFLTPLFGVFQFMPPDALPRKHRRPPKWKRCFSGFRRFSGLADLASTLEPGRVSIERRDIVPSRQIPANFRPKTCLLPNFSANSKFSLPWLAKNSSKKKRFSEKLVKKNKKGSTKS